MSLSIIAAMDQNQLIGTQGEIPWELPADLKYFKQITMGSPVIMGRKTFESIGFPLPGRKNIIITRKENYSAEGCEVVHSPAEILNSFLNEEKEAFIIGGAEIYRHFLAYCNKLYLTIIDHEFSGDTYFPEIDWKNWLQIQEKKGTSDSNNPYKYSFYVYQRKNEVRSEIK
ncbi:MAG: dihydrofolate reductase [Halanaerobium sp.]